MRLRTGQPFTLLDSMILIAATGVGMAVIREFSPEHYLWEFTPRSRPYWLIWTLVVVSNWALYLYPLPAAWTLAILVLRLRQPRTRLRRVFREPGMAASCAALMGSVFGIAHYILDQLGEPDPNWQRDPFELTLYLMGGTVGGAWLILRLGGIWRAKPTWIDRLGRALGLFWIAMVPLSMMRWVFGNPY